MDVGYLLLESATEWSSRIQKLWDDLYQFNRTLLRSTAKNENAIVKIEEMARNWVVVFAAVYGHDKITP